MRPQPPLAALHFFAAETEEEKRLRRELGFGAKGDGEELGEDQMEADNLDVSGPDRSRGTPLEVEPRRPERTVPKSSVEGRTTATPAKPAPPPLQPVPTPSTVDSVFPGETQTPASKTMEPIGEPFMYAPPVVKTGEAQSQPKDLDAGRYGMRSVQDDGDGEMPEMDSGLSDFEGESGDDSGEEETS